MPNSPDGRRPSKADAKHTAAHDAIMHAFQMFDIDSDGRITREEFVSALTRKCAKDGGAHSLTEDQANALFDEADVDRSNCIDAEEVNKMRRRTSTPTLSCAVRFISRADLLRLLSLSALLSLLFHCLPAPNPSLALHKCSCTVCTKLLHMLSLPALLSLLFS